MSKTFVLKKIASFTIIELMITLLISAIVISMGYFAYFLINAQFTRYQGRAKDRREYSLLQKAWQTDFDRSSVVMDTIDHYHILFGRQDTTIRYSINAGYIIRQSPGSSDSFALKAAVLDTWYTDDTTRLIKGITLDIDLNDTHVLLPGARTYSAKELMLSQKSYHE
jgi:prepilin-type N-terminal cleavage/methylation domain-containing protein